MSGLKDNSGIFGTGDVRPFCPFPALRVSVEALPLWTANLLKLSLKDMYRLASVSIIPLRLCLYHSSIVRLLSTLCAKPSDSCLPCCVSKSWLRICTKAYISCSLMVRFILILSSSALASSSFCRFFLSVAPSGASSQPPMPHCSTGYSRRYTLRNRQGSTAPKSDVAGKLACTTLSSVMGNPVELPNPQAASTARTWRLGVPATRAAAHPMHKPTPTT
mmetsp:Transcript_3637/g.10324  ORF Transcript_3637/g.10324 Transcript_3637/m.10324 type:complete len:219 (-) Transcript_3637:456-1112(-)